MSFILRSTRELDSDPIRSRERMGDDLQRKQTATLMPSTTPVPLSAPPPPGVPGPVPTKTAVPGGSMIIETKVDGMSFIPTPNSGLTLGGPTIPGGSGPTFPVPGGFAPQGGQGIDLSGLLGQGLEGLINRGVQELGDALFGGSEPPTGQPSIPGTGLTNGSGPCPGATSVFIGGRCVNLGDLGPGGPPAVTGTVPSTNGMQGFGQAVRGMYGPGIVPRVEARAVRKCPKGMVLGDDGVCYKGLARTRRMWDPGMKPLMTGGDRAAIRRAERAANKLKRAQKKLKSASKALGKAC